MKDLIAALLALLLVAGTSPSPVEPTVPEVEGTVSTETEEDDYDTDDLIASGAEEEPYTVIEKSLELELKEVKPFLNLDNINIFLSDEGSEAIGAFCSSRQFTSERISTFKLSFFNFIDCVPVNPTMDPYNSVGVSYKKDDKFLYITSYEYDLTFLKDNSKLQFMTYDGSLKYWEADIPNNYDTYMKSADENTRVLLNITAKIPLSAITKENMYLFTVCNALTYGDDPNVNFGYMISDEKLLYRYFIAPEDILVFSYGIGYFTNDFSPAVNYDLSGDYDFIYNSDIVVKYVEDLDMLKEKRNKLGVNLTDDNYYAILKRWAAENKDYISAKIKAKQEELDSRNDDASYLDYDVFVPTLADIEVLISNSNKYITELNNYLDSIESE